MMSENKGVWVYSESYDLTLEMLGKGRELADQLKSQLMAVVVGHNVHDKAAERREIRRRQSVHG